MTEAQVEEQVEARVRRPTDTTFTANLSTWVNMRRTELCRYYPFWFLHVFPAALTSLIPSTHTSNNGWYNTGWLVLQTNTAEYPVHYPVGTKNWIQQIDFVKLYNIDDGSFSKNLEVLTADEYLTDYTYVQTGTPERVLLREGTDASYLRFEPIPDEPMLAAVGMFLRSLPTITSTSTDILTTHYPDVLIAGGCAEVFNYLQEDEAFQKWETQFTAKVQGLISIDKKMRMATKTETIKYNKGSAAARHRTRSIAPGYIGA